MNGFLGPCAFGLGIMLTAPYYAYLWGSPLTLFFAYIIPILPFVLVFDGWISSLRTRKPEEVEVLLRTCGARGDLSQWQIKSGRELFFWPFGYVSWIICLREELR